MGEHEVALLVVKAEIEVTTKTTAFVYRQNLPQRWGNQLIAEASSTYLGLLAKTFYLWISSFMISR